MSADNADHLDNRVPRFVEIYDTTLARRQPGRGPVADRRRQAAGRRATRPPRRPVHRGGLARSQPQGRGVLPPGDSRGAALSTATLVAFGSTRKAGGRADTDPSWPTCWRRETEVVCLVAKSAAWHVTETLRTTLTEAVDMVADSVAFLTGRGQAGVRRRRALLRRLPGRPRVQPQTSCAWPRRPAPRRSSCATPTAAPCPSTSSASSARCVGMGSGRGSAATSTTTPGCAVANSLAAVRAGAVQVQGCVNGYGERTGNADLVSVIANLTLKMGMRDHRRRAPRAPHLGGPPHRRAGQPAARPPPALRRGRRPSPTRPGCTPAPSPGRATPTSTSPPSRSATAPVSWSARWPAGRPSPSRRSSSASSSTARPWREVVERLRSSSTGATTSRWPTARSSC